MVKITNYETSHYSEFHAPSYVPFLRYKYFSQQLVLKQVTFMLLSSSETSCFTQYKQSEHVSILLSILTSFRALNMIATRTYIIRVEKTLPWTVVSLSTTESEVIECLLSIKNNV
jgi:hypothetical protein